VNFVELRLSLYLSLIFDHCSLLHVDRQHIRIVQTHQHIGSQTIARCSLTKVYLLCMFVCDLQQQYGVILYRQTVVQTHHTINSANETRAIRRNGCGGCVDRLNGGSLV
jgi:hypothetical protein